MATEEKTAPDSEQTAPDAGDAQEAAPDVGEQSDGLFSELKDTARDAALEILKPVVRSAAQSAAEYAASKGPDMVKDKVGSALGDGGLDDLANKALSNMGPVGKVAGKLGMGGKLVDSVTGDGDDEEGEGAELEATGSGRRMPVQQAMDVAVPLETAYNQWTQFEEYPDFMQRVDSTSQDDETHVTFTEKVWGFSRDFKAEITEQRPNERIVWRSESGLKHAGVVTFHELAERLTRIEVTVDFKPESLFQKFARGARFSKRAIRADMHRFKAYVEMNEEEDGAWRGRIEDGEVVEQEDQETASEEQEQPEGEVEEEEQPEAEAEEAEEEEEGEEPQAAEEEEEESEEPQAAEEEEEESEEPQAAEEEEEEPEEEEEERPAPRRRRRPTGNGRRRQPQQQRRRAGQRGSSSGQRRSPQRPRRPRARSSAR